MLSSTESDHIFDHYYENDESEENYNSCPHPQCFIQEVRQPDGTLKIRNPHLSNGNSDFLYHFGFGTESDLAKTFADVKVSWESTVS